MKRSRLMGFPFLPSAFRGVSLHISFTFSSTMLQWRSKALTRASSLRLLRVLIRTWVWLRTAVWSSERGPEVNSWVSRRESSYSLGYGALVGECVVCVRVFGWVCDVRELGARLAQEFPAIELARESGALQYEWWRILDFGVGGGHVFGFCGFRCCMQ